MKDISISRFLTFIIVSILVVYPIIAIIPFVLNVDSTPISITYRSTYFLASVFLIFCITIVLTKVRIQFKVIPLVLFWLLYTVRMIYDLSIRNIEIYESDLYFYQYAILGTFLPMIAIILHQKRLKLVSVLKWLLIVGIISMIGILYMIFSSGAYLSSLFAERGAIAGLEDPVVGALVISRDGGMLATMSSFLLWNKKKHSINNGLIISGILLGLCCLILGASKGPILSFAVVLVFQLFILLSNNKKNAYFQFRTLIILLTSSIAATVLVIKYNLIEKLAFLERFIFFFQRGVENEERYLAWVASFTQIKQSPIIGERMVENLWNFYPHNIYIEIVLATGIIGFVLILISLIISFNNFRKEFKNQSLYQVFHILFWMYLLYGLTGVTIHSTPQFWILFCLTLYTPPTHRVKIRSEYLTLQHFRHK